MKFKRKSKTPSPEDQQAKLGILYTQLRAMETMIQDEDINAILRKDTVTYAQFSLALEYFTRNVDGLTTKQ